MQGKQWILVVLSTIVFMAIGYLVITLINSNSNDVLENTPSEVATDIDNTLVEDEAVERSSEDVILKIDDQEFSEADLNFLKYLQLAQIDYYEQEEGEDWSNARRIQESDNTQLQNLIELTIMESLGEEKGYEISEREIQSGAEDFIDKFGETEHFEKAQELAGDNFDEHLQRYIYQKIIIDSIIEDLSVNVTRQFPDIREADVSYEAGKEYQLLLADERGDHRINVFYDFE